MNRQLKVKIQRGAWLALLPLLLSACISATNAPHQPAPADEPAATEPATEDILENVPVLLRMTFAGDCTLAMYNGDGESAYRFPAVYENSGSLTYPFDLVKHLFERDDLTVINFEGTLTETEQHARRTYFFKGPPAYADMLSASSIEAAAFANNHARDYLEPGFTDTITHLRNAGVAVFYEDTPLIKEIQGVEVVLIGDNAAFLEGITEGEVAARVLRQIEERKREDNIVVVNIHWGVERAIRPNDWQTKTARLWIDAGADLVVGHHPHLLQGVERYNGKYIVYSLGNFAFGGISTAPNKETAILHVAAIAAKNQPPRLEIAVTPCYYTSSNLYRGSLPVNNYQPMPVAGARAEGVMALLSQRGALLENGVTELKVES